MEQTERLAHHAFLGEVWDRAVGYCRQAGTRTLQRMASWESVSFFERALSALAHRPADTMERGLAVDLRCDLHNALVLAEARRDTYSLTYALLGLGGTLVRRGQMWEAKGVLERGVALCADMPAFYPPFAGDLALVYALPGRMGEALELAERGVRQAQSMQRLGRLSLIVTHLGEVRLLAGQTVAAEAEGRRALALAEAHQERGNMVYARRLLGLAAAEGSPPDVARARGHYLDTLALAEELGMRPLAARGHLGLGRLARRAGDATEAERHLATARELFQEMRMIFWLERMELDQVSPAVPGRPEI